MSIVVIKPGLLTSLQSRPRIGQRHLGVPAGGAADPLCMALANKLVGNAWDAPVIEATLLGPTLKFDSDCTVATAGAAASTTLNGAAVEAHETIRVSAGSELAIGATRVGARIYVAVAGGFVADDVLGSTSTNLQAGFGGFDGRALHAGDVLQFASVDCETLRTPDEFRPPMTASWAVHATASAESDALDEMSHLRLFQSNWIVDRRSDRMGLRLEGPKLHVSSDGRMPSAGVVPGAIQCPEDGSPYVLSVDCGTVGGYPRIAQVARVDRHVLGQLRPGDHLRLLQREPDEAVAVLHAKIAYWREWLPEIGTILR